MFNNIFFKHLLNLSRPLGAADRSTLPIAGDSAAGKRAVTRFLESIGYDALDYGPLAESWRQSQAACVRHAVRPGRRREGHARPQRRHPGGC